MTAAFIDNLKTIYIAGAMRGIRYFNFPAFDAARDSLIEQGWNVISPADLDREIGFDETAFPDDYDWIDLKKANFNLNDAIDRDVEALKRCDAIYMLQGWENSKGANAEKALAEWMGLDVLYQVPPKKTADASDVLMEAFMLTTGDRNAQYGPPDQDFARTAAMWTALFGRKFESWEVAQAMCCLKLSRLTHQRKRDSVVDLAGYTRCMDVCYRAGAGYES